MSIPARQQIKWKLTLVILVTSVVVLLLGAFAFWTYDSMTSRANLISHVDTMAEITGANCAVAMLFHDRRDAQEPLDALGVRSEIDLACLFDTNGVPFVHFSKNGMTVTKLPRLPGERELFFDEQKMFLKRPIYLQNDLVGSIVICANLKHQAERSRTLMGISVLLVLGLTGVALLLATRLQRLISDPIARLAKAANHITNHRDYSLRVPNTSADEIGSLVVAFNQMLTEIDRQNRNLVESRGRLKLALSASQMGVWEWNVQTGAVFWSEESERFYGRRSEPVSLADFGRLIHEEDAGRVLADLNRCVVERASITAEYRVVPQPGKVIWVAHHGQVRCDNQAQPLVLAGIVQDISNRKRTEAEHQHLIAQLLRAEEDERRRIARELHDTTTQHLAVLKISLSQLSAGHLPTPDPKLLAECRQLIDQALQEVRTLAYVLHPPVLEEFGLVGALKDFALGVSRRSSIRVSVCADEYTGRLPRNTELTLFRVVQESVSNAVRHSNTREISIRLARDSQEVRVEIQDSGRGFSVPLELSRSAGVGIAAMHERVAMVGGMLNIESEAEGVTVLASVPIFNEASSGELTAAAEGNS